MVADTPLTRPPERSAEQILTQAKREVLKRAFRELAVHERNGSMLELAMTRQNLHDAVRDLKALSWTP